jgi:hypothetical protein
MFIFRDTIRNLVNNTGSINLTIEAILATANNHAVIEPIDDGNEVEIHRLEIFL